jgi:hypothetical protein
LGAFAVVLSTLFVGAVDDDDDADVVEVVESLVIEELDVFWMASATKFVFIDDVNDTILVAVIGKLVPIVDDEFEKDVGSDNVVVAFVLINSEFIELISKT